jgi:hypothetical protein
MKVTKVLIHAFALTFATATFAMVKQKNGQEAESREQLKSFTFNYDEPLSVGECSFFLQDSSGQLLPVRIDLAKSTPTSLALKFPSVNKARYTLDYSLKTLAKETVDGSVIINFE